MKSGQECGDEDMTSLASEDPASWCTKFDAMGLHLDVLRGIYFHGLEQPLSIQQDAIRDISQGRDVIIHSPTPCGKTTACIISLLQVVAKHPRSDGCRVLMLVPLRRLVEPVADAIRGLGEYMHIRVLAATGGTDVQKDVAAISAGVDVVVATPGRVGHLLRIQQLSLSAVRLLVLDEADMILVKDLGQQVRDIVSSGMPEVAQVVACAPFLTPEAMGVASKFMRRPSVVSTVAARWNLDEVAHVRLDVKHKGHKTASVCALLDDAAPERVLVLCNTASQVVWCSKCLFVFTAMRCVFACRCRCWSTSSGTLAGSLHMDCTMRMP